MKDVRSHSLGAPWECKRRGILEIGRRRALARTGSCSNLGGRCRGLERREDFRGLTQGLDVLAGWRNSGAKGGLRGLHSHIDGQIAKLFCVNR